MKLREYAFNIARPLMFTSIISLFICLFTYIYGVYSIILLTSSLNYYHTSLTITSLDKKLFKLPVKKLDSPRNYFSIKVLIEEF